MLFTKAVDLESSRANFILNDGGVRYNNIELDNDDYQYLTNQIDTFSSAFVEGQKNELESKFACFFFFVFVSLAFHGAVKDCDPSCHYSLFDSFYNLSFSYYRLD